MNSYTLHITLYDLFFFGMIFAGLNFALLLAFAQRINRGANRFLAVALVVMILWMIRILAIDIRLETYLPHWDRLPLQLLLALGPLIYFYVLKITRPEYKFRWRDSLHFAPLLAEQFFLMLEIRESTKMGLATYATPVFQLLNPLLQLLIFISIITYLYKSYHLIQNFYRRLQPVLMDRSRLEFRWLRRLIGATALLWFLWIAYAAVDYFGYRSQLGIHVYYPFYIFFAVIIIWTAAAAFLKPQAAVMAQTSPAFKPVATAELREKAAWLKKAMEVNRYYQDAELSLNSLADKLRIAPRELSRIINTALKKSFNDFVNEYRVRDVARKMQDPAFDHITLLGIAHESGFNSQSTFTRIFKQMTGKSPLEYKNEQKKDCPSHDLGSSRRFAPVVLYPETPPKWSQHKSKRNFMFRNYLKISWRNLLRNKSFTITNLLGLTIGITCTIFIFLWVTDELNFDKLNTNYPNIYQVVANRDFKNNIFTDNNMVFPLSKVLENGYPEIKNSTMSTYPSSQMLVYGNVKLKRQEVVVSGRYFDMFTCKFIKGDAATALKQPNSVVLTQSTATAFFGNADPINKTLKQDTQLLKVTAVIADMPGNSTRQFDCLTAFSYSDPQVISAMKVWQNFSYMVYLQLASNAKPSQVEKIVNKVMFDHNPDKISSYFLFPMSRWHLYGEFKDGKNTGGQIEYVQLFTIIAIIILLIACVNFMNLSTARSEKRAREVGIRKTLGSDKKQLVFQFFCESMILVAAGFVLSVIAVYLLLPAFNIMVSKQLALNLGEPLFWIGAMIIIVFTGVVAGSYPALYLSSFNPVKVLKGTFGAGKRAVLPRRILVVGQFAISIFLIAATIIIYQQIQHVKDRDLGYNPNNLIMMPATAAINKSYAAVKDELLKSGLISSVVRSSSPITEIWWKSPAPTVGVTDPNSAVILSGIGVDVDFTKTMGIKMLEGHDYAGTPADTSSIILNKAAVEAMHLKNPVGTLLHYGPKNTFTVIGVMDNVVMTSPYQPADPLMVRYIPGFSNEITVRLKSGVPPQKAITLLNSIYTRYSPADIFEYSFVDQVFAKKFIAEELIGHLTDIFAGLAIFICCIGLAGLASFTIEKRFREIGIRKVLGATIQQLLALIATEFLKLVLIAFVIAVPVTWWLMHNWLQKYPYHVAISIWMFGLVGVVILLLTMLVVSMNTLRAATTNPVKSLRSE